MQKPQTVIDRDLTDAGGHTGKSRSEVSSNTGEECAGLLHAFLLRRNGDVLLLNEIVALRRLAQNKRVSLSPCFTSIFVFLFSSLLFLFQFLQRFRRFAIKGDQNILLR